MTIRDSPRPTAHATARMKDDGASATRAASPHGHTTRDVRNRETSGTWFANPRGLTTCSPTGTGS